MNYVVVLERVESNVYNIQENEHEGDQVGLRKEPCLHWLDCFHHVGAKPVWHLHSSAEQWVTEDRVRSSQ